MDALQLLRQQHQLIETLFDQLEASDDEREKRQIFNQIADCFAVNSSIEERFFYPTVRASETESQVVDAYREHLGAKMILLECMRELDSSAFDAKVAALRRAIELHVAGEERELFQRVKQIIDAITLEALGQVLEREADRLEAEESPRHRLQ
jgi:hemerythrin superfamily protein